MIEINLDRDARVPLHQQIYLELRWAILDGHVATGTRLPSTRSLARRLGVSRNTVLNAYEALTLEGLLVSRIGSGTRIRKTHPEAPCVPSPPALHAASLLRQARYPADPAAFEDPDGNLLYAHR